MLTEYAFLKPWLSALALPPGSTLLLLLLGYLLVVRSRKSLWKVFGKALFVLGFAATWLLSCHGTAVWLERIALRPPAEIQPLSVTSSFKIEQIQAIVVLGGGKYVTSREYGSPQLSDSSAQRLHYGAHLAMKSGLPLAFSGGSGWAAASTDESEAAAAARWLQQLGLTAPRWLDEKSKDTAGNAQAMAQLLKKDGIKNVALVTHANHMPRAAEEFRGTGLNVLPAPVNKLGAEQGMGLDWFPSGQGMRNNRRVLHEILGLAMQKKG